MGECVVCTVLQAVLHRGVMGRPADECTGVVARRGGNAAVEQTVADSYCARMCMADKAACVLIGRGDACRHMAVLYHKD